MLSLRLKGVAFRAGDDGLLALGSPLRRATALW